MMTEDNEDQIPGCHDIRSNYTLVGQDGYQEGIVAPHNPKICPESSWSASQPGTLPLSHISPSCSSPPSGLVLPEVTLLLEVSQVNSVDTPVMAPVILAAPHLHKAAVHRQVCAGHCSSLESLMEFGRQQRPSGPCNLLGVPGLSFLDMDDDECEVVISIRPKSSPLPRRRSCDSDEDSGPEPSPSGSRRVSFADAKGLNLVQVKEFDTWDVPKLPGVDTSEGEGKDAEEYFLAPLTFSLPLSTEELLVKVREQKVELETIQLLPGTTILKGVIRVLNISFSKVVYVRTTLDTWSSHFDLLTEYMPDCSDSLTDCFSFKLTLVPPFGEQGARVDFCLRYETPVGTFWANNNNSNYVLFCHQREKERKESPLKEKLNKKSCLKTVSQNFSAVENISAPDISADHGEESDTMKAKQISDGQSGTSEKDRQKLQAESRQNRSRRSHRKAARVARVRDYFSQRNGGVDDHDRDESPPEANQTAEEETHSDVRSFPEGRRQSEGSHYVSESPDTCSEPLLDVPRDTSPAHDCVSNSETGKSESVNLADSAALTGGERSTDMPDNPSNDEPAPARCQNINKSVEESSPKQRKSYECISNVAADSGTSAASGESLVSQTNSFTFGTVVAPLYHQMFDRTGSENPVRAPLHVGDLTQSYQSHTERIQTGCTVPTDAEDIDGEVQGNAIATQESNRDNLNGPANSPPMTEEEETSLSLTANDIHAVTLQDPDDVTHSDQTCTNTSDVPKTISEDTVIRPHAVNILNADLSNPRIPSESLQLRGEAREDNLTHDLQLPEHTCAQAETDLDETQEVMTSLGTLFMSPHPSGSVSECVNDETDRQTDSSGANDCRRVYQSNEDGDVGKMIAILTADAISEKDKPLEASHDLNPKRVDNSATKETEDSYTSCFEIVEERDVTPPQISLETNNVEEGNKAVNNENDQKKDYMHGDMCAELKDEDARRIERCEAEGAVAKQEGFCLDTTEVNWEMMVDEEEKNVLTDEEECKEVMKKDQGQLGDAGRETPSETSDMTEVEKEDEMVWESTVTRENEKKPEDEDDLEGKQRIGEEESGEIVVVKDREEDENEPTNTAGEEELAEEIEVEKKEDTELEKEKLFEKRSILEKTNVRDGEVIEEKVTEVNVDEENLDYKETILVDETGESMTVDSRERCLKEKLDITRNKVGDGLSTPVNNVQDKSIIDKENGPIPAEMHLHEEEGFQSDENVTRGLSKAAGDENQSVDAEGGWCIFTDEPESNQTGHDSASAESDSDEEMELYMHCLRAVHTGARAQKDRSRDAGFGVGKLKHSASRSKLLSTPMPAISESLDEEQHLSRLPVSPQDTGTAGVQPAVAAPLVSSGQASVNTNVSWWKETFSCSNITKTLLNATLLVVFLVVAYHYDFLACFGLYLISVVWLYCQGERQPGQQKQQQNRLK